MDYLDTLNEIKESVGMNEELSLGHKMVILDLISKESEVVDIDKNPFIYFYEDVIEEAINFNFEPPLTPPVYQNASDDALNCLNLFRSLSKLKENSSLTNWLQNALKFTDHLALHYLQEIVGEAAEKQGQAGKERSLYIQINEKKNSAQKAGRILDNLYDVRNKLEHRTVSDPTRPGFQRIISPNYRKAKKNIIKRYPEALICFRNTYKDHYE